MLTILALIAAISLPPKPDRYVTDRVGVLKDANALNEFGRSNAEMFLAPAMQRSLGKPRKFGEPRHVQVSKAQPGPCDNRTERVPRVPLRQ